MKNFAYALAATACLIAGPAVAGSATVTSEAPIVLAQGISVDVGGGDRGRGGVIVQERNRGYDRGRMEMRDGYRSNDRAQVIVRGGGDCRMIMVRERMRNGRVMIRKVRRCG